MPNSMKNKVIFVLAVVVTGAIAGAFVWAFFFVMNVGIDLLWEALPTALDPPFFYPLIFCLIGGLAIGLYEKKFGPYPKELNDVVAEVKEKGRFEYDDIGVAAGAALLPLLFGGSIGPEAGLTGTIASLCTWVGDRMKRFGSEFKNLTTIGISAALSAIFMAPLFGVAAPLYGSTEKLDNEEDIVVPQTTKIIIYLCAIAGALGAILLLGSLIGRGGGLPHYSDIVIGKAELILLVPLILAGALGGWFYHISNGFSSFVSRKIGARPVLKALIAATVLGGVGIVLPFTMFAGEHQMFILEDTWMNTGVAILLLTGFFKLFITPFCIQMGWRGGHFFPVIFAGVAIGYGFAALTGADPVFCMCAVCGAVVGGVMRQPLMAVLLLFLCFPVKGFVIMLIAAVVGSIIPLPERFAPEKPARSRK